MLGVVQIKLMANRKGQATATPLGLLPSSSHLRESSTGRRREGFG